MEQQGITRARVRDHFRRLWVVYLVGAALILFLNNLAFTIARPSFSEEETLKIMLLNVDLDLSGDALLPAVEPLGFRAVEVEPLAVAPGDPTSEMLLAVQLTGGFGDLYICDAAGMEALSAREACLELSGEAAEAAQALLEECGLHIAVMRNGTGPELAAAALPDVAQAAMETMNTME